jgi:hypothetical protein
MERYRQVVPSLSLGCLEIDFCFGTTVTNRNFMQKEINIRFLTSRLVSKNFKIRKYKTIIVPVFSYGCENWSLTLRAFRDGAEKNI